MNIFGINLNRLAAGMALLLLAGCSGGSGGAQPASITPPPPSVVVDFSFCDVTISVGDGTACVIQPSKTDAAILDEHPDSATNPNVGPDTGEGYGYHVVSFPATITANTPVHVHLHGTFTRPFDQNGSGYLADANGLHATVQLEEASAAGYIMIQLAYANRDAVNTICAQHRDTNNCAELVRRETILGDDLTDLADVDLANSIDYRLIALLAYLEANVPAEALPVDSSNVNVDARFDWSSVRVGGHSQGSGHAFYIAKNFGAQHACLLGGPFDVADDICPGCTEDIADWYQTNTPGGTFSLTPRDNVRGLIVQDDPINIAVQRSYGLMGLTENRHWINLQTTGLTDRAGDPLTSHAAAAKADEFSVVRAKLCFSDEFLAPGEFPGL